MDLITITSPVGPLQLSMEQDCLVKLEFLHHTHKTRISQRALSKPLHHVCDQLEGYFGDPHWHFDLKLHSQGTLHQKKVWRALMAIKPGKPMTYGGLAGRIKSSARAVGGACRSNPTPLVVPCHRVIAASSNGGFCGQTSGPAMQIKQWLLEHESWTTPQH